MSKIRLIRPLTRYEREVLHHALTAYVDYASHSDRRRWGAETMLATNMVEELMWVQLEDIEKTESELNDQDTREIDRIHMIVMPWATDVGHHDEWVIVLSSGNTYNISLPLAAALKIAQAGLAIKMR